MLNTTQIQGWTEVLNIFLTVYLYNSSHISASKLLGLTHPLY